MTDKRELVSDLEESLRTAIAGQMRQYAFTMPCLMTQDTPDGHSCVPMPSVKRAFTDPTTGEVSYLDHPIAVDIPISYAGGGGVVATHPIREGDEGWLLYADRSIDATRTQGGTAQPMDDRQHHLGDALYLPSYRTDPRKLSQVSNDAHHVRSDDKRVVAEVHPQNGISHTHVDPSTPPASASFDPLSMATTFYRHVVQAAAGILGSATSSGTTHTHGVTHTDGAFMTALNGLTKVLAHPTLGGLLSAAGGAHTVTASPTGVMLSSTTGIGLSAPSLSLPTGGISGEALAPGAAAANVGALSGDLAGELPNPTVTSIAHLVGMNTLPRAASDGAAAAAGVPIGSPYLNTAVASGAALLAIRIA